MWKAAIFVLLTITAACGAYGKDPSAPGGPDACLWEGHSCQRSSDCCSAWCVSGQCERKMAEATPLSRQTSVQ
jgi:hypothetical protein